MRPRSPALLVAALYVLHQDFWFWRDARPLVFGFLPIGLFYHAAFTVGLRPAAVAARDVGLARASRRRRARPGVSGPAPRSMIPAAVVFAYLAVALYIGVFAFRSLARAQRRRGLLPGRPIARPGRVPAVAVRRQHDGVLDPRRLRPRVRQRHRHLRADGVVVGAGHPDRAVRHRHAVVGARPAQRLHDAGADVPRPLGVRAHRHGDLRRPGGAAGALHHHRGDGRRHDARGGERRPSCRSGWAARSCRWW